MEGNHKELQLLLPTARNTAAASSHIPRWSEYQRYSSKDPPSLDLQLSISVRPLIGIGRQISDDSVGAEALKWHAAEQIRLAALEKAYAERVRELTRREMEMAQSEFARARHMWERAREEVDRAEKLKEMAMRGIDPMCMELTCQACRQKFRP